MNITRFTLLIASGALGMLGLASACLSDLAAFIPVDAVGDAGQARLRCGDSFLATLDDGGDAGEQCDPGLDPVSGCTPQCAISCGGRIGPAGHCYFLADPSDYATALSNCRAAGGGAHVVTIGSDAEREVVRGLVGSASYRVGLIVDTLGGYQTPRFVEEPGWPLGGDRCPGCFALGVDDAGSFAPRLDAGGPQPCVIADSDDRWLQVPCDEPNAPYLTVCEREPAGQRAQYCAGPYCTTLPATAGRKRYVISLEKAGADAAQASCRAYDGGSLVVLESRAEREQLARELRQLLPPEARTIWIGLAFENDEWRWDDGVGVDAGRDLPWAKNEPKPTGRGRAFMQLDPDAFDTQLAVTAEDAGSELKPFVCQRR